MKKVVLSILSTLTIALLIAGCAPVEEDPDSELPWTTPDPWEQEGGLPMMTK